MKHSHPPIRFVYFDIGGVFLKWKGAFDVLAIKHKKSKREMEEAFDRYDELTMRGSIVPQVMWEMVQEELQIPSTDYADWHMVIRETFIPILETHRFARSLIKKIPIGILSNIDKGIYDLNIRNGFVPNLAYSAVIQSCDIGIIKPETKIYEHARVKTGVSSEHLLFVDDVQKNLDGASALGWQTFLFDTDHPHASVGNLQSLLGM